MPISFQTCEQSILLLDQLEHNHTALSNCCSPWRFSLGSAHPSSSTAHHHCDGLLGVRLTRSVTTAPFASILGSISSSVWSHPARAESIRSTFNKIDKNRKGRITEADLQEYAEAQNLPRTYVRPFMEAILQQQQQQPGPGAAAGSMALPSEEFEEGEVSYSAFKEFVSSREQGLREAFSQFDLDGDGSITADDLALSLARVAICRPRSRCVARTRHQVVDQLLARLGVDGTRRVSFAEFRAFFMLLPQQSQLVEYWLSGPAALECADTGGVCRLERNRHRGAPWGHLLAGAVAGAVSRSATAPLETLRLAAMAGTLPPGTSMLSAGRQLVSAGGVSALYKGNLVNVMRSAPARAVDFLTFDVFKSWFGSDTYIKTFAAAGLAGMFSWALLYPLEVVRSRVTLDLALQYTSLGHCVRSMLVQEGPGAFYRGLGPSLAAIAPEAAITYGLHDLLKRGYREAYQQEPGVAASLWCGVAAAWTGQMVAFPLETVSRRMQLAGTTQLAAAAAAAGGSSSAAAAGAAGAGAGAAVPGGVCAATAAAAAGTHGMLAVVQNITREAGPAALYRGIGAATLRLVPSAMISFGTYEVMRRLLLDLEAQQEVARAAACHQQLHKALKSAQQCNRTIQQLQSVGIAPQAMCAVCDQHGNVQTLSGCELQDGNASVPDSSSSSGSGDAQQLRLNTASCSTPPSLNTACSSSSTSEGSSSASLVRSLQQPVLAELHAPRACSLDVLAGAPRPRV